MDQNRENRKLVTKPQTIGILTKQLNENVKCFPHKQLGRHQPWQYIRRQTLSIGMWG